MFGLKPKHTHEWGEHIMVKYLWGLDGSVTDFRVVCTTCGKTGRYKVKALVEDNRAQREYVKMAKQNGWFK